MNWRVSSHSKDGGACTEVASWRTSAASGYNGNCVQVGQGAAVVGVRDSKLAESPVLVYPAAAWTAFTARLKTA